MEREKKIFDGFSNNCQQLFRRKERRGKYHITTLRNKRKMASITFGRERAKKQQFYHGRQKLARLPCDSLQPANDIYNAVNVAKKRSAMHDSGLQIRAKKKQPAQAISLSLQIPSSLCRDSWENSFGVAQRFFFFCSSGIIGIFFSPLHISNTF